MALINGGKGGQDRHSTLNGGTGNDIVNGSLYGGDIINAGAGNDSIVAGDGIPESKNLPATAAQGSLINGDAGSDTILGSSANDTIYADSGPVNLVVNGSFEIDNHGTSPTWYVTKNVNGWHTDMGDGIEIESGNIAGISASDGNSKVELDSNNNSNMWQEIHTAGTGKFLLSFDYSPRPGISSASNKVEVLWNGKLLDTFTGAAGGWVTHNYTVSGAGADTKLEFRAAGISDSLGGFLDNVKVVATTPSNGTIDGSSSGGDIIHGGAGNDYIQSAKGIIVSQSVSDGGMQGSLIYGDAGSDTILGSSASDTIYADSGTASNAANLVVNGSFEIGTHGPSQTWYVTKDVNGWHTNMGDGIEIESGNIAGVKPSDGNSKVELDSNNNSNMWQEIHTGGTGQFLLSFDYSPRPGISEASNIVEVYWNGKLLDTLTGTTGGWVTHNYAVSGSSNANTKLEFHAAGISDSLGGFIDNVKVVTDIPNSPGMITGGLGADMLYGGPSADNFIYTSVAESTITAHDTIFNFTQGEDKIDLSALKTAGIVNFANLHITSTASQTIITSGQFELNLQGVIHLHASDFVFGS